MAESPEVPEAKDPFERKIALSIAIMAVILALIGAKGDDAKTEAIIHHIESNDSWSEFQTNSIKKHLATIEAALAPNKSAGAAQPAEAGAKAENSGKEAKAADKYEEKKKELEEKATELKNEAKHELQVEHKLHIAEVLLQIAIVLSSIAILTRWHVPWFAGMALGAGGAICGAIYYFV